MIENPGFFVSCGEFGERKKKQMKKKRNHIEFWELFCVLCCVETEKMMSLGTSDFPFFEILLFKSENL